MTLKRKVHSKFDMDDAPELTPALLKKLRPASELMPPALYEAVRKRGQRGKQKSPTKNQVTLRLDPEVTAFFKATGSGWQTRINDMLKAVVSLAKS